MKDIAEDPQPSKLLCWLYDKYASLPKCASIWLNTNIANIDKKDPYIRNHLNKMNPMTKIASIKGNNEFLNENNI